MPYGNRMTAGEVALPIVRFLNDVGHIFASNFIVISPDLQKAVVAAAHSVILLKKEYTPLNLQRMERVIGRHGWSCLPTLAA